MDTEQAYVWRLQNFVIGEHILRPCPENPTPVKACAISACGNFAVLGTAGGWIERFNLQSGISQGSYVDDIPFDSLAFSSIFVTLNLYIEDVKSGKVKFHYGTIKKRLGTGPSDIRAFTLDYHLQV